MSKYQASKEAIRGPEVMRMAITALVPLGALIPTVAATALVFLALLGGVSARVGGARVRPAAIRVTFWGALAMGLTAGVGALFGAALP